MACVRNVLTRGSWRGGGGINPISQPKFCPNPISQPDFWPNPSPSSDFREIPGHGKSKLKHCAVNVLIFGLVFFWSVLSLSVPNTMTIKLWVCIGRLNMFPLRSASWVDDVMWCGNYFIAPSGCHHESTILDFLIFPWRQKRTKLP